MVSKRGPRRQQVARSRIEFIKAIRQHLRKRRSWTVILSGGLLFFGALATALTGTHRPQYSVGQKIDQPITAEVPFEVVDKIATLRNQQAARAAAASHYRVNDALITRIETGLRNLYQAVQGAETFEDFVGQAGAKDWGVDESSFDQLKAYSDEARKNVFEEQLARLRRRLKWEYTRDPAAERDRNPPSTSNVVLVHTEPPGESTDQAKPVEVSVGDILPISSKTNLERAAGALTAGFPDPFRTIAARLVLEQLLSEPLLVYDASLTQRDMARRAAAVEPVTIQYLRNDPIVPVRPEQGITLADLELLKQHDAAYEAFLASEDPGARELRDQKLLQRVGVATVLFVLALILVVYVNTYQPRVFDVLSRGVGLCALVIGTLVSVRLVSNAFPIKELIYGPPLFAASILAIAYSRRFSLGVMTIAAAMMLLTVRGDEATLLCTVFGLIGIVWLLSEVRTRTRILMAGFLAAVVLCVGVTAFGVIDGQSLSFAARRGFRGATVGFVTALLLQATLPLIERAFGIVTSLTLLEWRDTTRPLLQRLAREAPGTYAHSLALGTLADNACRAIGANGLLAQVGALYHDIGKMHKASYFTENQDSAINRHDSLAPTMSLLIIIGHVKDGIELAKEYKLPRVLHPFILEHHGTTVVRYFHHIASEQQPQIAQGKHDREVPEAQFRYPGPKPHSKETAVLMLCDGAESAVRSLSEPTPARIESVVHQIVTSRLNDGQFDECDITLRELNLVEESLAKNLCSYYHGRVAYPKAKEKEKADRPGEPEHTAAHVQKSAAG